MYTNSAFAGGLATLVVMLSGADIDGKLAPESAHPLDGLRAVEQTVNTYTSSTQDEPSLAIDTEGRMLVTWSSRRQERGTYGVFAQLLDPLGRALGTEMHVNESMPGSQHDSYARFSSTGDAWVVWSSQRPDTEKNGVFLRRLSDDDQGSFGPSGNELRIGDSSFHVYSDPALAIGSDGQMVATWVKHFAHTQVLELVALSAEGERTSEVLTLERPSNFDETLDREVFGTVSVPDLVALPDGGFFAVWATTDDLGRPQGIFGRTVSIVKEETVSSFELGDRISLAAERGTYAIEPSLDVDGNGQLILAWMQSDASGGEHGVFTRRFDASGNPTSGILEVEADLEGRKSGATAIAAPDGRFAVAYNLHGGKLELGGKDTVRQVDVRMQLFAADGEPLAAGRQISTEEQGTHALEVAHNGRRAAWTSLGQLALAWSGVSPTDGSGVTLKLFTPEDLSPPAPEAIEAVAALAGLTEEDMQDTVKPDLVPPHLRNLEAVPATFGAGAGTGFQSHDQTQFTPPDPAIAVGPDRIVTEVNGEIAIFDKGGVELFRQGTNSASGFWGSLGGGSFIFDPVNAYDVHSNRFFVMNSELATGDFMTFAVSTTSSPSGTNDWHKYRVQVSPVCNFPDFPNIGNNDAAYYITTDCFSGGGNRAYIFDKAVVDNGGALGTIPSVQMSAGLQSLGNTKKYDTGSTQYFVSAGFSGTSPNLTLQAITNPTTAPAVTTFVLNTGQSWISPPDAPQLGTTARLDTIDNRVKHGVVRNDRLYCTHNIGVSGVTRVRWYEIALNGWPSGGNPSLIQSGDINLGAGIYTWFGDAHPDAAGNLAIAFNRSASNERASIEYVTRLATDPPGTTSASTTLQISTTADTSGRWGDYGYIDEDPTSPGTFYAMHEYSQGPWATWVDTFSIDQSGNDVVAQFSGTPLSGTAPLSVDFTDLTTGTGISAWAWSFGDGGTSSLQDPTYVYNTSGTFDVTLTATGTNGSDSEFKSGYVVVGGGGGGSITKYGVGLGGANIGTYCSNSTPVAGGSITLDITDIPNGTTGLLWLSLTQVSTPMFGGTLLADLATAPARVPYTLVGGSASVNFTLPPGTSGLTVYSQAGARDTSQVQGIALTNGLIIVIP